MTAAQRAAQAIQGGSTLRDETIKALQVLGDCRPAHYSEQADLFAHAVTAILGGSHQTTDALLAEYFAPQQCEAYMPEEPEATLEEYLGE